MSSIEYEVRSNVAEIALDAAPVNALTESMLDEMLGCLVRASADPLVRAVILHSNVPRRFCAGLNLETVSDAGSAGLHALVEKLYVHLYDTQTQLGKPSIAAVSGAARGGGMTLAISCDVLLAGESATFGYPEIDLGLVPAIHFVHLPRIVGRHRAFELLFSGRSFGAAEAASLGLVSRVVPDETLRAEARAMARAFAEKPRTAMRLARAAFLRANDDRRGIAEAVANFCDVAATAEAQEGMRAFIEKRAPKW